MGSKNAWVGARQGPRRRHKKIIFFACEGLIAIYDERASDGGYQVVTPTEFKYRALALAETARRMSTDEMPWVRQDGQELLLSVCDMLTAIQEAKDMGDPSDPAVQAFWARHNRRSTVAVGPRTDLAGYPALPPLPRGHFTGRTAAPGDAIATAGAVPLRRRPVKVTKLILPTH
jgi:cytochrome c1